jgi:hypothetical protein
MCVNIQRKVSLGIGRVVAIDYIQKLLKNGLREKQVLEIIDALANREAYFNDVSV